MLEFECVTVGDHRQHRPGWGGTQTPGLGTAALHHFDTSLSPASFFYCIYFELYSCALPPSASEPLPCATNAVNKYVWSKLHNSCNMNHPPFFVAQSNRKQRRRWLLLSSAASLAMGCVNTLVRLWQLFGHQPQLIPA